ncbi:LAMI_0D02234g1_1 [Lachancea mirantina]|uniref:LAMI_0D02234g1_1 n=1 Tax=Lachancea mirantina TaxID=1230905 RepID=A0A1G4J8Z7_9SACH|nr:LAMI_0D02234g1_1 [Lachancea mirantina]
MAKFYKLILALLFLAVGYQQIERYCVNNEDAAICEKVLLSRNVWLQQNAVPWWETNVEPLRAKYVAPQIDTLAKYEKKMCEWTTPRAKVAFYTAKDAFDQNVRPFALKWYKTAQFKVQFYYQVNLASSVRHLQNVYNKWIFQDGAVQRFGRGTYSRVSAMGEFVRNGVATALEKFSAAREDFIDRPKRTSSFEAALGETTAESLEQEPATGDDIFEDETITLTSVIIETVTLSDGEFGAPAVSSLASESGALNLATDSTVELSVTELVQDEFEAWANAIERKAANTIAHFNHDVESLVQERLDQIHPDVTALLRNITNQSQAFYQAINKAIMDVNCTAEIDPETNETIYFDRHGTQLDRYITRPLMRELFNRTHVYVDESLDHVGGRLEAFVKEIDAAVDLMRHDHLEIYEEWGDVMVSEWSRRMAYVDVVAALEEDDLNKKQHENWKDFLHLKKLVIGVRDKLINHPAQLHQLQEFLNEIQVTLRALQRESGEYLFILRSKANLAFQSREKLEREREEQERLKRERDELERQKELERQLELESIKKEHEAATTPELQVKEELSVQTVQDQVNASTKLREAQNFNSQVSYNA